MSCTFSLPLSSPISLHNNRHKRRRILSPPPLFSKSTSFSRSLSNSHICFSSFSNPDQTEEVLWLREEQRWLREEHRWLREEQRWLQERESLLAQIQSLKLQIQALEKQVSAEEVEVGGGGDMAVNVAALLQILKERNLIAESGSSRSSSSILVEKNVEEEVRKEVISKNVEEEVKKEVISKNEEEKDHRALRKGSEGQLVREMQV